jgi:uncharacterized protein YndB with AHSA1/START domain
MAAHSCELLIEAPAERVFELLTKAEGLSRLWRAPVDRDLAVGVCAELPLSPDARVRIPVDLANGPGS